MRIGPIIAALLVSTSATGGELPGTYTATYRVTFDARWSAETHPQDFPANAHFSPLIGAIHGDDVEIWRVGGLASQGMESMAETGSVDLLRIEMEQLRAEGLVVREVGAPGIDSPGMASFDITVDRDNPRVTFVSMIAPSPDWFVGVAGLPLERLGEWYGGATAHLSAYDAGTDRGLTYTAPNVGNGVQEVITFKDDGPFADTEPLGTLQFDLLETSGAFPITGRMSGLYFAPDRSGEGVSINVARTVNGLTIAMTWYTYLNGNQIWLVGSATLSDEQDQVTIEMFRTNGAQFGDAFNSDEVALEPWGAATLRFPDCGVVEFGYEGIDGSGELLLEPLVAEPFCEVVLR